MSEHLVSAEPKTQLVLPIRSSPERAEFRSAEFWHSTGVTRLLLLLLLLLLGLHLLLLFRSQLSLFLFFSFALVFASATVAHIHSSSVRLEARNAPRQSSKTQRHSESIAAPKDAVLCKSSAGRLSSPPIVVVQDSTQPLMTHKGVIHVTRALPSLDQSIVPGRGHVAPKGA